MKASKHDVAVKSRCGVPDQPCDAPVFVVDDDASVRRSVMRLLRSAGYRAEGFDSAHDFMRRGNAHAGCCIVLDVQMDGMDGLELQRRLAENHAGIPVVFITAHGDVRMSVTAMKHGAVDFLTKPFDDRDLLDAVKCARLRHARLCEQCALIRSVKDRVGTLTIRELEVMRLVIAGLLNKQIAGQLAIAEKTVKVHRGRMMAKMQVASVAELVRLCLLAGFAPVRLDE